MTNEKEESVSITVPQVSGEQVDQATDRVEEIIDKYSMSQADADTLFESMVKVFIRTRMIYGDREPQICSMAAMQEGGSREHN